MPIHSNWSRRLKRTETVAPLSGDRVSYKWTRSIQSSPPVLASSPIRSLRSTLKGVKLSLFGKPSPVVPPPITPSVSPSPASSPPMGKGDEFVVVHAGNSDSPRRLPKAWLTERSGYFAELFNDVAKDEDGMARGDGKAKHRTSPGVSTDDFDLLIAALQDPDQYKDAPQEMVATLLRVAFALACEPVITLAKDRFCTLWDSRYPPQPESYRVLKMKAAREISGSYADSGKHTYQEALAAIRLGREYDIPGVIKRASYELASSAEFGDAVLADPDVAIGLSEVEIQTIQEMRTALAEWWWEAILTPPRYNADTKITKCHRLSLTSLPFGCKQRGSEKRTKGWKAMMTDSGEAEAGQYDPFRYDVFLRMRDDRKTQWCTCCIREWETMLAEKRAQWWTELVSWR
ncbi:hypothetical protein BN946_scf184707.g12 [Trametes cinnabarina]|uniref:BTB domain-containing protein n=1 Tax=Pycnoporus cinnabarinus TaxID=5643 RepID=A0A060S2P7_PYCCI|nr:hypothetical protein BN946_scf184707.g12 [Trametes cinnabarina]